MKLSTELSERGFIHQASPDDIEKILDSDTRTFYLGIDPTADAMHVGHLVPYMLLNHLMRAGHKAMVLVGGGTALIGDPSGKDVERDFVEESVVKERQQKLEANVRRLTAENSITFVNNYDWLSRQSMLDFLRDVGKHFTVNAMVKKESVAKRLESEQGISFTEFSYALMQSYDYYHLHREYGCDLQIGASDQWGNITSGIDFIRRTTGDEVYGLTTSLLVNPSTGMKFGKSEGNAVWLDPEKTSPYAFYQFWLNTPDDIVESYLKLFTFLSLEDIAGVMKEFTDDTSSRSAQRRLAEEVTAFVHGTDVSLETPLHKVSKGDDMVSVLVSSGLASSKREARAFIESGAVTLDGEKVTAPDESIRSGLLQRGKKKMNQVRLEVE